MLSTYTYRNRSLLALATRVGDVLTSYNRPIGVNTDMTRKLIKTNRPRRSLPRNRMIVSGPYLHTSVSVPTQHSPDYVKVIYELFCITDMISFNLPLYFTYNVKLRAWECVITGDGELRKQFTPSNQPG